MTDHQDFYKDNDAVNTKRIIRTWAEHNNSVCYGVLSPDGGAMSVSYPVTIPEMRHGIFNGRHDRPTGIPIVKFYMETDSFYIEGHAEITEYKIFGCYDGETTLLVAKYCKEIPLNGTARRKRIEFYKAYDVLDHLNWAKPEQRKQEPAHE